MMSFKNVGPEGIKDLRFLRPGYTYPNPRFTKEFLTYIGRFKTLRFMDWLSTNNNPVSKWSERCTPQTCHGYHTQGLAWEYIIELANIAQKDIYINVPFSADEDYIRNLALLLKATLNPITKVYVEFSNEVWNWGFGQAKLNLQLAQAEWAQPGSLLNYDGKGNSNHY
jgi:hypothetical protein